MFRELFGRHCGINRAMCFVDRPAVSMGGFRVRLNLSELKSSRRGPGG